MTRIPFITGCVLLFTECFESPVNVAKHCVTADNCKAQDTTFSPWTFAASFAKTDNIPNKMTSQAETGSKAKSSPFRTGPIETVRISSGNNNTMMCTAIADPFNQWP